LNGTAQRLVGFDPEEKLFQIMARAFNFDNHALRGIVDPAIEREFRGKAMDEGTETDALNGAANRKAQALAEAVCSAGFHARILPEAGLN
jgi:hypothetical protein